MFSSRMSALPSTAVGERKRASGRSRSAIYYHPCMGVKPVVCEPPLENQHAGGRHVLGEKCYRLRFLDFFRFQEAFSYFVTYPPGTHLCIHFRNALVPR